MASSPINSWWIEGENVEAVTDYLFLGSKITAYGDCSHEIRRQLLLERKAMANLKSKDITLLTKVHVVKTMVFPVSHVWMWEVDHKEGRALTNWCFEIVVLEKTLESPLHCKDIQPVYPKGNQQWLFIGRTDAEAEALILWQPDAKNWLTGKDFDSVKYWGQEEKGATEDEMVGWHHQLSGHEFEQPLGDSEGQGSLVCCSPLGYKELDTTKQQQQYLHPTYFI